MANGSKYLVVNPGVMTEDGDTIHLMKASSINGGVTLVAAYVVPDLVGTLNVELLNYGSAGTAAAGTVAAFSEGTAAVMAAGTPETLTITAAQAYLDAGEWLVAKKTESAVGNDFGGNASIVIEYVEGVVTQG